MSIDWNDPYYGEQYVSGRITLPIDWQARATAAEAENAKLRSALAEIADATEDDCETAWIAVRARAALETDHG